MGAPSTSGINGWAGSGCEDAAGVGNRAVAIGTRAVAIGTRGGCATACRPVFGKEDLAGLVAKRTLGHVQVQADLIV